jgi:hypothetical protein
VQDFDCFLSGGVGENGPCSAGADCAAGLVCGVDTSGNGTCFRWCHPAGSGKANCSSVEQCTEFSPAFVYNGVDYGYCF